MAVIERGDLLAQVEMYTKGHYLGPRPMAVIYRVGDLLIHVVTRLLHYTVLLLHSSIDLI